MIEYTLAKVLILLAVGLVAGIAGGLLGIGGSVVFIPALGMMFGSAADEQRVPYGVFAAAALVCNVFVGAGGAVGHWRARRVIPRVAKMIYPLGIVGAVVGVLAAGQIEKQLDHGSAVLWLVFGVVLAYMVGRNIRKLLGGSQPASLDRDDTAGLEKVTWPRVSGVALPTGFLAGMLGIGGGTYSVPSQQAILHMPQKNAIANSAATMIIFCAVAAVVKFVDLPEDISRADPLILAGLLIPPAILGAYLGGHLTHRLPDRLVRALFTGILVYAAWGCFFSEKKGGVLIGRLVAWLGG